MMPLLTPNSDLLIDSNSYFRLAQGLHPLLGSRFCKDNKCIYIIKECDEEFSKSNNLQNKFGWVKRDEYTINRQHKIQYTSADENAISNHIKYIRLFAKENYLIISPVDEKFLAVALEFNIILITDDSAMLLVAEDFDIKTMKTVELLKTMLECNHIDTNKVKEITDYWVYNKDTPKDFKADCKRLFDLDY